jgi:site-specific DNA-cytosine methylase
MGCYIFINMKATKLSVLSLCDGISCAYLALSKLSEKFEIIKYYSSEIDKDCIKVQMHHYSNNPNFIRIGDVKKVDGIKFADDEPLLVIFGSSCQNLSAANRTERTGLKGSKSSVFYEIVRIINEIKTANPNKKLFILAENVNSMRNVDRDIISNELGLQPVMVNSKLLSAQVRHRNYWCSWSFPIPEDKCITYQSIIEKDSGIVDKLKSNPVMTGNVTNTPRGLRRYLKMGMGNIVFDNDFSFNMTDEQRIEFCEKVYQNSGYDPKLKYDPLSIPNKHFRVLTVKESCRLQTIPDFYLDVPGISKTQKFKMVGNAMTVDVITHILSFLPINEL